jgi:MFS family permease
LPPEETDTGSSSYLLLVSFLSGPEMVIHPILTPMLSLTWTGLVSYYIKKVLDLVGITDSTTQLGINGGLQIFNFIVALTMCFFVDKIGRRKLFLTSTAGMLGAFIIWTICSEQAETHGTKAAGNAVVAVSSESIVDCEGYDGAD